MTLQRMLRIVILWLFAASMSFAVGCSDGADATNDEAQADAETNEWTAAEALPTWTFDPSMVWPADGSLFRPEDGVALSDGQLLVVDQPNGLRLIAPDGSSAPFGEMLAAGYIHEPPEQAGGANGVSLEPDGTHVLVADVFHGGIFRVDVETGEAEQVYQHSYGINTAIRDSRGAIWFTQSAQNTPEEGEARMWAAVDVNAAEGALLRLAFEDGMFAEEAEVVRDGIVYANGIAIDEASGQLYLAETLGGRVLRYDVDLDAGTISNETVVLEGITPDNLELDGEGHLWVASPLTNALIVIDTETGEAHTAFQSLTPDQQASVEEFVRRGESGEPRMELLGPDAWAPLPGLFTGVIVGDENYIYLTGLGAALVRLPR